MQFKISEKSLFARLLRARWWISFLVAAGVTAVMFAVLPNAMKAAAVLSGIPFIVIGCIAAWKQRNTLSPAQIEAAFAKLSTMSTKEFTDTLATTYKRKGYTVQPHTKPGAELEMEKNGYTTLVSCKRWKAANHGVESLRELLTAMEKADNARGIYVALNAPSDAAVKFATGNGIRTLSGSDLADMTRVA